MAQRVITLACTVPPTTPIAAPQHFPLVFPAAIVERIDVIIPPGPSGLVGFYIGQGGGSYLPDNAGSWIVADDKLLQWPTDDAPNNGNWEVVAYNTDAWQHTIYVYFSISDLPVANVPGASGLVGL